MIELPVWSQFNIRDNMLNNTINEIYSHYAKDLNLHCIVMVMSSTPPLNWYIPEGLEEFPISEAMKMTLEGYSKITGYSVKATQFSKKIGSEDCKNGEVFFHHLKFFPYNTRPRTVIRTKDDLFKYIKVPSLVENTYANENHGNHNSSKSESNELLKSHQKNNNAFYRIEEVTNNSLKDLEKNNFNNSLQYKKQDNNATFFHQKKDPVTQSSPQDIDLHLKMLDVAFYAITASGAYKLYSPQIDVCIFDSLSKIFSTIDSIDFQDKKLHIIQEIEQQIKNQDQDQTGIFSRYFLKYENLSSLVDTLSKSFPIDLENFENSNKCS